VTSCSEELRRRNRDFYDSLWQSARFEPPERFNTWEICSALAARARRRLEVGSGMRPRLPVAGTYFLDLSPAAMRRLRAMGGHTQVGDICRLPFASETFDLVSALDVLEHVEDDEGAMSELARVSRRKADLLLSVPLYRAAWTDFDRVAGHHRRYEPEEILALLDRNGFTVLRSAVFGMKPRSSLLADIAVWCLDRHHGSAMKWYNRLFFPLGLKLQKPLELRPGFNAREGVDNLLLHCRRER